MLLYEQKKENGEKSGKGNVERKKERESFSPRMKGAISRPRSDYRYCSKDSDSQQPCCR